MHPDIQTLRQSLREKLATAMPADNSPLSQAMRYSTQSGGKLYRPLFAVCLGIAYGAELDDLLAIAVALELLHTFTLVHDDIMDNSVLRRGREAAHIRWGTNLAILTGDALLAESLVSLLSLQKNKLETLEILIRGLPALSRGQARDLQTKPGGDAILKDYREMAAWKTGTIFSMGGEMAAVLAGASADTRRKLRDLGEELGIAYQLRDDFLDLFSFEAGISKDSGRDLLLQKPSLLVSMGVQAAPDAFREIFAQSATDAQIALERARQVLLDTGVHNEVLKQLQDRHDYCMDSLSALPGAQAAAVRSLIHEMLSLPPHNP